MKKKYFITCIFFIIPWFKCISQTRSTTTATLSLSYKETKLIGDSIVALFYLVNKTKDTIIFPKTYLELELAFENSEIYRPKVISTKIIYPHIKYKNNKQKKRILESNCRPLLNSKDYILLANNDSLLLPINIMALGYIGFKEHTNYKVQLNLSVSDQIKCFCAKIWSGFIISDFVFEYR